MDKQTYGAFSIHSTVFLAAIWPLASTLRARTSSIPTFTAFLSRAILWATVWPILVAPLLLADTFAIHTLPTGPTVLLTAVRPLVN